MELPKISDEQKKIVKLYNNYNVIVDSVAGSGKTTTILYIAKKYKNDNILLLTYNKKLKNETRNKVLDLGINNLEVHNYHSFCVKYYKHNCYTDSEILEVLNNKQQLFKNISYNKIILDEAQDITPLYYELICKIYKDNNKNSNICILGDKYQSIYSFNKADERFIIYGNTLFNLNKIKWKNLKLSTSFRITNQMSSFINNCLLNKNRIIANKNGTKVRYIICNTFGFKGKKPIRPIKEIQYYLHELGYSYKDIFILAPSIKGDKSPIRQLSNYLSIVEKIPIYVPSSDEEKIDEDIIKNKLVFSTFHQVKGLERKVIIIYNFDNSYFKFYKKNSDIYKCPNEIYVAVTRGIEQLSLFHHYHNDYLPFINKSLLNKYCYYEYDKLNINIRENINDNNINVTNLTKHLSIDTLNKALKFIDIIEIQKKDKHINIPIKIKENNLYESVSEINGVAIPAYFEYLNTKKMSIYNNEYLLLNNNTINNKDYINSDNESLDSEDNKTINDLFNSDNDTKNNENNENIINDLFNSDNDKNIKNKNIIKKNINEINENDIIEIKNLNNIGPKELLFISNNWCAKNSGYQYKLNQITKYNWLSEKKLNKCCKRLYKHISPNAIYEQKYLTYNQNELYNRTIVGIIDCIDNNNIWEFKCVEKIKKEHFIQLAFYNYIYLKYKQNNILNFIINNNNDNNNDIALSFYIFNILDNNIYEIKSDIDKLSEMVKLIIFDKYYKKNKILDVKFINDNLLIKNKYFYI